MPDAMHHNTKTIVLYDGWCSVCSASATKLQRMDKHDRLNMIDLREDPSIIETHALDPKEVRRVMHAITPDGEIVTAMDALRATMSAIGRGWMLAWTRIPIISWICDRLYLAFANNRLRFFKRKHACDDACSIE